jgi:endonuclease III
VAVLNKTKATLAVEYNRLDEQVENEGLSTQGLKRLKEVADELSQIWALEEIKIRPGIEKSWRGIGTQPTSRLYQIKGVGRKWCMG